MSGKQKVDVLLVNPGSPAAIYQELSSEFSAFEPPSLAALFATYVRVKGGTVDIVDAPIRHFSPAMTAKYIADNYDATLIVMVVYGFQPSASTQNMMAASETCTALKQLSPQCKIMMTGTHPAALPARTLNEEQIDFVCSQEGPQTIWQTFQALKAGSTDFSAVPSLWYKRGGVALSTPKGLLLDNLDADMPGGAWDLLPMDKYRAHNWHCFDHINDRQPYASIHTSLGCPYKCTFCCINAPFGKSSYRMWSPKTVVEEIDVLVNEYGIKNIKFVDEMFVLKRNHVIGICDLLIERNYDLNIWAYARVDTVKDEFLEKLRAAGIRWLALGIESGSKHVRDGVEKGRFGSEDIIKVVRKIQAAGIYVIGNYIFGLPDDTTESMNETLDLAIEANCEFANFYCAMAYPGSKLYDLALEKKWALPDSWIGYSQHAYESKPLRSEALPASEILKFRDNAFHRYFTNPNYLALVKRKFGQAVHDHVADMTKIKLRRQLIEEANAVVV
ncbi:MAG: B12-binding domain-containing radical SAM protein [Gammaproteobacteria bacterium RIFCSPHIGHO2_02_FULL_39_13]|nr:MAG: B12-binding domain-containing radical SAM protein [Gammaproteobacteria bacterium RIFCSPHIGHO2_02_FULL_39_13]OGT48963.1 MAG: B12-binding domain-containing radical SAM protein [Gammaproteobacteria bacterium RIFCSPHIGHO2_12_FULL_39_24]